MSDIEVERRFKLDKRQFNIIKNMPLGWSPSYRLTDISFSKDGKPVELGGWIVRIRDKNDGKFFLGHKEFISKEKKVDIEVEIGDVDTMMKILLKMGLHADIVLDRIRTDCIWDNFKLSLDDFEILGHFLEIERVDPNEESDFNLFSTHFNIELGSPQLPYGKILLKEMESNAEVRHKVKEYIKMKSKIT